MSCFHVVFPFPLYWASFFSDLFYKAKNTTQNLEMAGFRMDVPTKFGKIILFRNLYDKLIITICLIAGQSPLLVTDFNCLGINHGFSRYRFRDSKDVVL